MSPKVCALTIGQKEKINWKYTFLIPQLTLEFDQL